MQAKLWDYIQKMEKEKENRDNEASKKLKKEMEQKEKSRKLSDEVENAKDELREAKNENEQLRKQVANLLEKMSSFRSELNRERERRSRSGSFSRRLTSFFITKSGPEDEGDEGDGLLSDNDSEGFGSNPGSRRESGRGKQQILFNTLAHEDHNQSGESSREEKAVTASVIELAEWKDKAQRLKEENDMLRRDLSAFSDENTKLREAIGTMRDNERKVKKEHKRERKLLAQSQQTIEELKLRLIDAQLLDSSPTIISSSPSIIDRRHSESHSLPISYSLPSTPHFTKKVEPTASLSTNSPRLGPFTPQPYSEHTPLRPQRFQSLPVIQDHQRSPPPSLFSEMQQKEQGQSMQDELAVIDDILADNQDSDDTRLHSVPATPRPSLGSSASGPPIFSSSNTRGSPKSPLDEKEKRVWIVAEGQRGRKPEHKKETQKEENTDSHTTEENGRVVTDKVSSAQNSKDQRLFIFAEELEKKVVQKFVYDEEVLELYLNFK